MTLAYPYAGMYGPEAIISSAGIPAASISVTVYNHGTTTAANLYTDQTSTTAATHPVTTDSFGNLVFFAAPGLYDLSFTVGGVATTLTVQVKRFETKDAPFGTPWGTVQCGTLTLSNGSTQLPLTLSGGTFSGTGGFSLSSANGTGLAVPISGTYLVTASAQVLMTASNFTHLVLGLNSSAAPFGTTVANEAATNTFWGSVTGLITATAGQVLNILENSSQSNPSVVPTLSAILVSA